MRLRLLYLILIGLLFSSASAQDSTLTSTPMQPQPLPTLTPIPTLPARLLSAESDWLFPFAAVFQFRLDARPNEITSAVVSISQEGWPSQTQVVQPQTGMGNPLVCAAEVVQAIGFYVDFHVRRRAYRHSY